MVRTLLIDADSTIPNLAICRLYRYKKRVGNEVVFRKLGIPVYGNPKKRIIDCSGFNEVYISAIFDSTPEFIEIINSDNCIVDFGGTGYDIKKKLPPEIYACKPDYSIYPDNDTSYGFIYRG